ncbi:MAG: 50S ribosomal protein L10 [Fidelibacterota bacterium]
MAREEKEKIVEDITRRLSEATGIYLTDFSGLNVQSISELRRKLSDASVEYRVVKNTLTRLSVEKAGYHELSEYLVGPTGIAFVYGDPTIPAKIITEFAEKVKKPEIKICVLEGKIVDKDLIPRIAKLPPKEVLIANLLGNLQYPLTGLINSLRYNLLKLVWLLQNIKERKRN